MTQIHAELTAGGGHLVLVAGGSDAAQIAQAAKLIKTLTPLFSTTKPAGGLITPATWPAVVQLSATFGPAWRPGPALQAWMRDQVMARTAPAPTTYVPPAGLTPFPWQSEGAAMIAATGGALITDEPGTGKTATALLGIVELAAAKTDEPPLLWEHPAVIVCPASVVDSWVEAWRTWAPHLRTVAWRGTPKARHPLAGTADVYVTSYDLARTDAPAGGKGALQKLDPGYLVIDECFPGHTAISTPNGQRRIGSLRPGDEVIGVDHETGEPVVTTVRHTFSRTTTGPLTAVNGVEMTANHPVWTERGYVRADAVRTTDLVCSTLINFLHGDLHAELRVVRAVVHENGEAQRSSEVLQPGVLGEVAHVEPGVRRLARQPETACGGGGEYAALAGEPRGSGSIGGASARPEQPVAEPRGSGEGSGNTARAGLPDAQRRERSADSAAEAAGGATGLGHGGTDHHGPQGAVPARVQARPGLTGAADRDRGGRREPQEPEGARVGHPAGRTVDLPGLDGAAVLEPRGAGGDRDGDGEGHGSRRVFNIETGTGNYVAGGLLVHNCHLIKNPGASRTKAVLRLASTANGNGGAVVALSGTPITHNPGDLHPALAAINHDAWPSRERWVTRYCTTLPGEYKDEILGLAPAYEPEFRTAVLGQHRRVAKADVLTQLPPKVYSVRTVDLPTKWRKVYDDFEAQMLAEMPDGSELKVMDVLAKMGHLARLASAAADVEITFGPDVDAQTGLPKEHVHLELKAPSWKVDALMEVLEERPGQPVVVFAPSRQLIMLAGAACEKAGLRVGYVIGGQTAAVRTAAVNTFQAGELDVICVTTSAGGVGITLTAARTCVFLQRPWSLVEAIQAEDRCHRIGSERHDSIEVIDIVARQTIDSRVRDVLRTRAGQLSDLVQDPRIVSDLLGGHSADLTERASA